MRGGLSWALGSVVLGDGVGMVTGPPAVPVSSLVLLRLGACCQLCWGQEEMQSELIKVRGDGSSPIGS